jgi:hypothetical protein
VERHAAERQSQCESSDGLGEGDGMSPIPADGTALTEQTVITEVRDHVHINGNTSIVR